MSSHKSKKKSISKKDAVKKLEFFNNAANVLLNILQNDKKNKFITRVYDKVEDEKGIFSFRLRCEEVTSQNEKVRNSFYFRHLCLSSGGYVAVLAVETTKSGITFPFEVTKKYGVSYTVSYLIDSEVEFWEYVKNTVTDANFEEKHVRRERINRKSKNDTFFNTQTARQFGEVVKLIHDRCLSVQ